MTVMTHHLDTIGREHLQRALEGRRERVGIETNVKRSVDILLFAVKTDHLGDRKDVRLVERTVEGTAAMPSEVPNATHCRGTAGSGRTV
jgi:hypothetical protein